MEIPSKRVGCVAGLSGLVMLVALLVAPAAPAQSAARSSDDVLRQYARDTWASFVAMTDPDSGLPADALEADGVLSSRVPSSAV